MPKPGIVQNQKITPEKRMRAEELRKKQTDAEVLLWRELKGNRLGGYHFRRQQIIDGFIVDFYCHQVGLIIEIDGPIHLQNQAYDREREMILRTRGLHLIRFTNSQVFEQRDLVKSRILFACRKLEEAEEGL